MAKQTTTTTRKATTRKANKAGSGPFAEYLASVAGRNPNHPQPSPQPLASDLVATNKGFEFADGSGVAHGNGIRTKENKVPLQCPNLLGMPMSVLFLAVNASGVVKWANYLDLNPSKGTITPLLGRKTGAYRLHAQGDPHRDDRHAGKLCACKLSDGELVTRAAVDRPEKGDVEGWKRAILHLARKVRGTNEDPVFFTVPRRS